MTASEKERAQTKFLCKKIVRMDHESFDIGSGICRVVNEWRQELECQEINW